MVIRLRQILTRTYGTDLRPYTQGLATLALIIVTAVWGSTYFMMKGLLNQVDVLDFLAIRFLLAAVCVVPLFWKRLLKARKKTWQQGFCLGLIYAIGQVLQTYGLQFTDPSISGFITGMYVVMTPLLVWALFGIRIRPEVFFAVGLATAGLMVLSLKGFSFGYGETVTLVSALLYALHIVLLARWAKTNHPVDLAVIQLLVLGIVHPLIALPGGISFSGGPRFWVVIFYLALVVAVVTLFLQTWAQSYMGASRAAIIMTTEPVFAAGFSFIFGQETPTFRVFMGGALVLAAMLVTEIRPRKKPKQ